MSDDVLFMVAASVGTIFGLWRVMVGRLRVRTWSRILGVLSVGLLGSLVVGGVQSVIDGGGFLDHRADLAAGLLLLVVMGMPLWGLVDERILARIGELGIASVGLAAGYQAADSIDRLLGVTVAVLSLALAFGVARSGPGWRLAGYGRFLAATVVLAVLEADGALEPLTSEIVDVDAPEVFAGFAAVIWLSFHAVFATKFVLIVATCVRPKGRSLALGFAQRVVTPGPSSIVTATGLLGLEAMVLASDIAFDWANNIVVVAVVIFVLPLAERLAFSSPTPDASR